MTLHKGQLYGFARERDLTSARRYLDKKQCRYDNLFLEGARDGDDFDISEFERLV